MKNNKNNDLKSKNIVNNMKFQNPVFLFTFFIFSLFLFNFHPVSADISSGLVGYWKLDETSGTTASDSAGSNNGTVNGSTFTTGKINNSLSFNGTSDYVSIPRMNYDEITISAWFYKIVNYSIPDAIFGNYYWTSDVQTREGFVVKFHNTVYHTDPAYHAANTAKPDS